MSKKAPNPRINTIQDAFRHVDPNQARRIRDAYYQAMDGLQALADALELADVDVGESNDHALIHEHLLACEALQAMRQCVLGAVL